MSAGTKASNMRSDSKRRERMETDGDREQQRQIQQSKAMMAVTGVNNMQFLNQSYKPDGGDLKNMGNDIEFGGDEMA